jgi:hypothetical protein
MGFNGRKMEYERRRAAEKEAANRRATDAQVLEDAERLIVAWNERQAKRMPMLFSPRKPVDRPRCSIDSKAAGSWPTALPPVTCRFFPACGY